MSYTAIIHHTLTAELEIVAEEKSVRGHRHQRKYSQYVKYVNVWGWVDCLTDCV